jgi:hypothetical protein
MRPHILLGNHDRRNCYLLALMSPEPNSLKELMGYKIVRRVPVAGDAGIILSRKPMSGTSPGALPRCEKPVKLIPRGKPWPMALTMQWVTDEQRQRLREMYAFTADMDRWYSQMQALPVRTLTRLVRLGDRILALLGLNKV